MLVYQADARIWLREESRRERRPVTLGSLSASALDALAERGFQWLWLRATWEIDPEEREVSRRRAAWLEEYREALVDVELEDIDGSPFAVREHRVPADVGGDGALEDLREELLRRDLRLMVDLVADPAGAACAPAAAPRAPAPGDLRRELARLAGKADGLCAVGADRPDLGGGFWPEAIERARAVHPRVLLCAECRDESAAGLLERGFDFVVAAGLAGVLTAGVSSRLETLFSERTDRLARFLESHGGRRVAGSMTERVHAAAAVVAYLPPGLRVVHDGQLEGRRRAHHPRLSRRAAEEPDREVLGFYERLLEVLARPEARGPWRRLGVREAWEGNETFRQLVVFLQGGPRDGALLTAVNYGPEQGQCYVELSCLETRGRSWTLQDLFSLAVYERDGGDLANRGLYLDLAPWDYNVFEVSPGRAL
ncbi:MAG: hypothetical protein HY721_05375 [Planctomycetes bacterium]|nr:hypothetical protein [Planctomycetota bacterium]